MREDRVGAGEAGGADAHAEEQDVEGAADDAPDLQAAAAAAALLVGLYANHPRGRRVPARASFKLLVLCNIDDVYSTLSFWYALDRNGRSPRAFGARHNVFFGGVEMAPCSYNTTALYDSTKFAVTPYNSHSATLLTNKVDSITIQYSGSLFPGGINVTARRPSSCQRSSAPR